MHTVKEEHFDAIFRHLPETTTLMTAAIVKLYFSDSSTGSFKYSDIAGALTLIIDRRRHGAKILRLYDLQTFGVGFEMELYIGFSQRYNSPNSDNFYTFPIRKGWVGFMFASERESDLFKKKIETYGDIPQTNIEEYRQRIAEYKMGGEYRISLQKYVDWKVYVNKGPLRKLGIKDNAIMELFEPGISKVFNCEQPQSGGWDPVNQCFKIEELPKELKELLKKAGISKKLLRQKEVALAVYEILMNPEQIDSILTKLGSKKNKYKQKRKKKDKRRKERDKDFDKRDKSIDRTKSYIERDKGRTRSMHPRSASKGELWKIDTDRGEGSDFEGYHPYNPDEEEKRERTASDLEVIRKYTGSLAASTILPEPSAVQHKELSPIGLGPEPPEEEKAFTPPAPKPLGLGMGGIPPAPNLLRLPLPGTGNVKARSPYKPVQAVDSGGLAGKGMLSLGLKRMGTGGGEKKNRGGAFHGALQGSTETKVKTSIALIEAVKHRREQLNRYRSDSEDDDASQESDWSD